MRLCLFLGSIQGCTVAELDPVTLSGSSLIRIILLVPYLFQGLGTVYCIFYKPKVQKVSVRDSHHFDADPDPIFHFDSDPDPDPACHFDPDPDTTCSVHFVRIRQIQIKAQNLEKVLKQTHIPYILACHLKIDEDPDPAYHFDADPDSTYHFNADPVRIRILPFNLMLIRIHNTDRIF